VKNTALGTVSTFDIQKDGALVQIDQDKDDSVAGSSIGLAGK